MDMKKNILIWGAAIILIAVAVYTMANYNTKKENDISSNQVTPIVDASLEKAINFGLKDLDGNTVSLSDYIGKNVYLNFFATWCPPCRGEMPDIEKVYQKYKNQDFVVLAIDLGEDRDTVKSFIENNKYNFKVLLDSDQTVGQKYRTTSIPVSVFIDKKGNIAAKQVGAMTSEQMELKVKMLIDKK